MWPFEMPGSRFKRFLPWTWYKRWSVAFAAGPESWPAASSTLASRATS